MLWGEMNLKNLIFKKGFFYIRHFQKDFLTAFMFEWNFLWNYQQILIMLLLYCIVTLKIPSKLPKSQIQHRNWEIQIKLLVLCKRQVWNHIFNFLISPRYTYSQMEENFTFRKLQMVKIYEFSSIIFEAF